MIAAGSRTPRTACKHEAVHRYDYLDGTVIWGCDECATHFAIEAEAAPASGAAEIDVVAMLREVIESGHVVPRVVADHEWPARCGDCGLTTEDPDAYHGDDEDLMPEGTLCLATGTFHDWVRAGTVRYLPADLLDAVRLAAPQPAEEEG